MIDDEQKVEVLLLSHTDLHWSSNLGTAGKKSRESQALAGHLRRAASLLQLSDYCQLQVNFVLKT